VPILARVPDDDGPSISLHSTWTGIVMSYLGAVVFLVFAIALVSVGEVSLVTIGLLVVALVFAAVVLFDLPIASEFRRDGVVRRAVLRHQFIDWDRVSRLRRLRVGLLRTRRDGRGGGLVAHINRRKYVLVDTMESAVEFDELRQVMGEWADALGLNDNMRPPDGRSPTWLYRKDRWKPDSARSR
jgi:hypothetical protein